MITFLFYKQWSTRSIINTMHFNIVVCGRDSTVMHKYTHLKIKKKRKNNNKKTKDCKLSFFLYIYINDMR